MYIYRLPNAEQQNKIFEDLAFLGNKNEVKAMYNYATNKPYQFLYVDVLKNTVWKWGNLQPIFMWSKFDDEGNYNPPFIAPKTDIEDIEDIEEEEEK